MKWNLNRNTSLGFAIAVITLIAVGIISLYSLNRFREVINVDMKTRELLTNLGNINSSIKELEAGMFGYVVSGDEFYLNLYKKSVSKIEEQITSIDTISRNEDIVSLKNSLLNQVEFGKQIMKVNEENGQKAAITYINSEINKKAISNISSLLQKIKADESRIQGLSSEIADLNAGYSILLIIIGSLCALIFLAGAVYIMNRDWGRLIRTEAELNKAIEIAHQAKNKEEQFLANMSHEIRTPMNAIIGMTNLILNTPLEPRQASYLKAIRQSSDNLMVIINEILDFSKITAGKIKFERASFDLSDIFYSLYNTFKIKADEKKIKITPIIDENLPDSIMGDAGKLNQVLVNLIGNSLKFTGPGGRIDMACKLLERNGDMLKIKFSVKDTGIGIPENKLETIFEDFAQAARDTNRKFGGTGLGLSISKKIVELQGGNIGVSSQLGKGSTFYFVLDFEESKEKVVKKETNRKVSAQELHGINILLVEDNEFNQVVAVDTLKSLIKKLTIDVANNGREAIELLKKNKAYQIILMDVQMPEMNGYETTRYIRENKELGYSDIPIIAMTASATKPEIDRCFESGMTGFVSKPFDADILLIKISSQLNKEKHEEEKESVKIVELDGVESDTIAAEPENIYVAVVEEESQNINLEFLQGMTGGNNLQMLKYITMFLDSVPHDWTKLKALAAEGNWPDVRTMAHSMKPRINYMGIQEGLEIIKKIEEYSGEEKNLDSIPELIITFENILFKAIQELEREKQTL